jgi:hypothetical protein
MLVWMSPVPAPASVSFGLVPPVLCRKNQSDVASPLPLSVSGASGEPESLTVVVLTGSVVEVSMVVIAVL